MSISIKESPSKRSPWSATCFLLLAVLLGLREIAYSQQPASGPSASPLQERRNTAAIAQMRKIWPNLPPNQDAAAVARGRSLFASNCSFCHGVDASGGNGGPDLMRSVLVNHDERGDLIGPTIHNGRVDKGMPAFKDLTDAQVQDLVAFLHQQNRDDRIRSSYKIRRVAVGNASAGKTYFMGHCAPCHSPSGDLAGIATKFHSGALQQLWLDPADNMIATEAVPFKKVTVTLPSGRQFTGKLQHVDEFDVALYDASGYHSFPIAAGSIVEVHDPLAAHHALLRDLTDTNMHDVTTYLETLK